MTLGIQPKEFSLCFICPENFVSQGLRALQVPLENFSQAVTLQGLIRKCCRPSEKKHTKGQPAVLLFREQHWSSVRVAIGFLVTSLTKAVCPALGSPGGSKHLPFTNDGSHCAQSALRSCAPEVLLLLLPFGFFPLNSLSVKTKQ